MSEETFGQRLKRIRKSRDLNQRQLADKLGLRFYLIAMLELDRHEPTPYLVQGLASALGCTIDDLYPSTGEQSV